MTIIKKYHFRSILLVIALLSGANARASTPPTSTESTAGEVSITQACGNCVSYDVAVWMFTPTRPGALKDILQSLNAHPGEEFGDGEGPRVISPAKSTIVADTFRQSGTLMPLILWRAESFFCESIPLESVSSSGIFLAELNIVAGNSRDLLLPGMHKPQSLSQLLSFMLKADQTGTSSSGTLASSTSGRVVLQNGSTLLNISRLDKSYLIWQVHVTYFSF